MAWFKVSKRREMDISTVAGTTPVVELNQKKVIRHIRLGYGGVAAMPARAKKTEAALLGKVWSAESIAAALPVLRTEFTPISDVRGTVDYRSGLITSLLEKFFCSVGDEVTSLKSQNESIQRLLHVVSYRQLNRRRHESAHKHVTGEAVFTDDFGARKDVLEVWPVCAPACARKHPQARCFRRKIRCPASPLFCSRKIFLGATMSAR